MGPFKIGVHIDICVLIFFISVFLFFVLVSFDIGVFFGVSVFNLILVSIGVFWYSICVCRHLTMPIFLYFIVLLNLTYIVNHDCFVGAHLEFRIYFFKNQNLPTLHRNGVTQSSIDYGVYFENTCTSIYTLNFCPICSQTKT